MAAAVLRRASRARVSPRLAIVYRHAGLAAIGLCAAALLSACAAPSAEHAHATSALAPAATPSAATSPAQAPTGNLERFPIAHYDQDVDHWIRPDSPDYDKPLLSQAEQMRRFDAMRKRYFGTGPRDPSPWNPVFLNTTVLNVASARMIASSQAIRVQRYDNSAGSRTTYGENFQPHTREWIRQIEANMALAQIDPDHAAWHYDARRRGITVTNALVRQLPTNDPAFFDFREAGEGYPFDALQDSALRPGTPVYTLATSADGAWLLVFTPDLTGWVDARTVASVDASFVATWRAAAQRKLGAIVKGDLALGDIAPGSTATTFRTIAPIGTVLPMLATRDGHAALLLPVADLQRRAVIRTVVPGDDAAVAMPWVITPRHIAQVMKQQIGRPYGWGNTLFYNDCSAETRSLFAPFGIWLERHSSDQLRAGRRVDLRQSDTPTRLRYLAEHGRPLMTLIHIPGHIMLYLGNATIDGKTVPITYQNIWGLSPADNSRRNVIGGSVIFPLLETYPEDPSVQSLAGKSLFEISTIDDGNDTPSPALPPDTQEDMPK